MVQTFIVEEKTIKKKSIKHSKENALEKHEQDELRKAIDRLNIKDETKLRYSVLIELLMSSGLRVSEAIQCRASWFNKTEDGVTINIPIKDRDLRNMKRDWTPKTAQGVREVIFLDNTIGSMIHTYMIGHKYGLGFSRQRANQIVHKVGESIGKPDLHPHALRSTYANNLIYQGVNTTTLQYYMGWANIQTALNYVRTSKIASRKDLLEKFNKEV